MPPVQDIALSCKPFGTGEADLVKRGFLNRWDVAGQALYMHISSERHPPAVRARSTLRQTSFIACPLGVSRAQMLFSVRWRQHADDEPLGRSWRVLLPDGKCIRPSMITLGSQVHRGWRDWGYGGKNCGQTQRTRPLGEFPLPKGLLSLAPRLGLEPKTLRLTAGCSTIELARIKSAIAQSGNYTADYMPRQLGAQGAAYAGLGRGGRRMSIRLGRQQTWSAAP